MDSRYPVTNGRSGFMRSRSFVISLLRYCSKIPIRVLTSLSIVLFVGCFISVVLLLGAIERQTEACNRHKWTAEVENVYQYNVHLPEDSQEVLGEDEQKDESPEEPEREPEIFKNISIVTNVVDQKPCRRNTGILVNRLRKSQKHINQFFQTYVTNVMDRWRLLPQVFNAAMDGFRYSLKPFKYYAQDEYKYFLEFSDPQSECTHITLGVGGSWDGEKALRRKYPQCRMTGVDPVEELSRAVVESDPNSRFILAAVSDVAGDGEALIKDANFAYAQQKKVPLRALTELLMNRNQGRVIDFMTIDVEGAEFRLLREIHRKKFELPIICQFNVEIHFAASRYNVTWDEFDRTLGEMFNEARFVVLNIDQRSMKYRRLFMFNIGDDECIQKFLC